MIKEGVKLSYPDIAIIPAIQSGVEHRSEDCNPYDSEGNLPIFTAPMSTVVNEDNFELFEENHIIPILPRNFPLEKRYDYLKKGKWSTVSLDEFENLFVNNDWDLKSYPVKVLIDMANGHMRRLCEVIHDAKEKYHWSKNLKIMAGNIANSMTYYELAKSGCDAVRLSIGTGEGCLTWTKLGVGYPIASLIDETYKIKKQLLYLGENTPLIIADGGIRDTCDVMKALALGADYVMIGGLLSKLVESAAPTFYKKGDTDCYINPNNITLVDDAKFGKFLIKDKDIFVDRIYKTFYGMASKRGQEDVYGNKRKTSEGTEKTFEVTETISKWCKNITEFLQSNMSYVNAFKLSDINPEKVDCCIVSQSTQGRINK